MVGRLFIRLMHTFAHSLYRMDGSLREQVHHLREVGGERCGLKWTVAPGYYILVRGILSLLKAATHPLQKRSGCLYNMI